MTELIKSDICIYSCIGLLLVFMIITILNNIKLKKINKKYNLFMKKLGNGNNIDGMLKEYIEKVNIVNDENKEIKEYCMQLNKNISLCIQKIGIVRYSAFKDTGSDLSFALALLDENNNGVILNGIYSREMSNIYAKQVKNGKSLSNLSEEESEALIKAVECVMD